MLLILSRSGMNVLFYITSQQPACCVCSWIDTPGSSEEITQDKHDWHLVGRAFYYDLQGFIKQGHGQLDASIQEAIQSTARSLYTVESTGCSHTLLQMRCHAKCLGALIIH